MLLYCKKKTSKIIIKSQAYMNAFAVICSVLKFRMHVLKVPKVLC